MAMKEENDRRSGTRTERADIVKEIGSPIPLKGRKTGHTRLWKQVEPGMEDTSGCTFRVRWEISVRVTLNSQRRLKKSDELERSVWHCLCTMRSASPPVGEQDGVESK